MNSKIPVRARRNETSGVTWVHRNKQTQIPVAASLLGAAVKGTFLVSVRIWLFHKVAVEEEKSFFNGLDFLAAPQFGSESSGSSEVDAEEWKNFSPGSTETFPDSCICVCL